MRAVLKASIAAGPEYMQRFVMGQQQATGQVSGSSNSNVPWCSCGVCHIFDDPRMNICCRQSPCITSKPEFRNLCLRHDVLEVANILNWSTELTRTLVFLCPHLEIKHTEISFCGNMNVLVQEDAFLYQPVYVVQCVRGSQSLMGSTLGITRHIQTLINSMIKYCKRLYIIYIFLYIYLI